MVNGATMRRFLFLVFKYLKSTLSSMNAHYFPFNGKLHHSAPQNLAESTARQHMCVSLSSSARHFKHMLLFTLSPTWKANPNWLGSIRLYIHGDFQDWLNQQPAAASSRSEFFLQRLWLFQRYVFCRFLTWIFAAAQDGPRPLRLHCFRPHVIAGWLHAALLWDVARG